ncbi:MAG: 2,3,4,5-tetrahydropyridine-2,6-dicarboxylate N-succinyltransferase [Bacteroidales bacterium]|nr:2,3,4,5-tetrahydropyridine-2,6-dicarboxylate N-succinyltransferase [Bacteroidales bacterium]MDD2424719.1 2,3,4,5-tetrahydropyridine-2,6-dicarboxylate N-succinyltransferase [Bacteroidales bacterium]MDD3989286.1 2,3,4,5-tetrahydropyridine-2,6-dicarboxylate N-succinyltransferase [Bacteroidales bacterium]MDD4638581.1 2,3,4,5-tetrahydropyridine-2,6-dicarboxylate N-succinyltransferase [Bacteroidales bacterium]
MNNIMMTRDNLRNEYERITPDSSDSERLDLFLKVRESLERGVIRVAEKCHEGWRVNSWIKTVILWGFKYGKITEVPSSGWSFFDKDSFPVLKIDPDKNIRLVPGGSSVRSGAYVAPGTVIMPPSYVNTGAYVDSGTMIDSHALVGSCAQIGKRVHISAATQIGGVLEPAGAMPVIIEDDVFVGGNCGIYEGCIVSERAVIGTGVIINASTPVFDNTTGEFIKSSKGTPLTIPQGAVIIPGSRPLSGHGKEKGMQIYCPVIIKYRDKGTDVSTALESALR